MARKRSPIVAGGVVKGGRILWDFPRLATAPLQAWEGERVTVTIAQEAQSRSTRANAYLWGVVYKLIADESGYSVDDLHELFKERHNGKVIADPVTGEETRIGQSTAKLSVQDFGDYIEAVMLDGATVYGISFPEPRRHEEWRDAHAA